MYTYVTYTMFLLFLFVSGLCIIDGWIPLHNRYIRQCRVYMNNYNHVKEYFDFYNEFKQPVFTGGVYDSPVDYKTFAEKNKDNYLLFEKNLKRIQEANTLLAKQNNTLKNAPHTQGVVCAETWNYSYSRQTAAFPLPYVALNKFWPTVARINNTHGDRNLICTCEPVSSYAND